MRLLWAALYMYALLCAVTELIRVSTWERSSGDAVDAGCPRDRCPLQPTREVRYLQGSFTHFRNISASVICVYTLDVQGSLFRETQVAFEHHNFRPAPKAPIAAMVAAGYGDMPPTTVLGGGHYNYANFGASSCPSFMSAGLFEPLRAAPPSDIDVTYTFHTLGTPVNTRKRMTMDTVCPNGLILNRNDDVGDRLLQAAPDAKAEWHGGVRQPDIFARRSDEAPLIGRWEGLVALEWNMLCKMQLMIEGALGNIPTYRGTGNQYRFSLNFRECRHVNQQSAMEDSMNPPPSPPSADARRTPRAAAHLTAAAEHRMMPAEDATLTPAHDNLKQAAESSQKAAVVNSEKVSAGGGGAAEWLRATVAAAAVSTAAGTHAEEAEAPVEEFINWTGGKEKVVTDVKGGGGEGGMRRQTRRDDETNTQSTAEKQEQYVSVVPETEVGRKTVTAGPSHVDFVWDASVLPPPPADSEEGDGDCDATFPLHLPAISSAACPAGRYCRPRFSGDGTSCARCPRFEDDQDVCPAGNEDCVHRCSVQQVDVGNKEWLIAPRSARLLVTKVTFSGFARTDKISIAAFSHMATSQTQTSERSDEELLVILSKASCERALGELPALGADTWHALLTFDIVCEGT